MTYEQIHNLFKQGYNQNNWKQFLGEVFAKSRLLASPEILTGIDNNVASQVQKLGFITLDENGIERQIAVYEVTLAQGIILERNRVGLRNLLRKYWKDIDAAFIVYHRTGVFNWRFTYVSELTGFNAEGDFIKIKTEPKRYTYILGEGESTRTAAERFTAIANKGSKATLDDVKEAFSVEKLSKVFFDEYTLHYKNLCDFLENSNFRKSIFNISFPANADKEEKDRLCKPIRDFNKKFLGRIVFLYFIQKKGWLGVPLKEDWGNGDFNFLTKQFDNFRNKDLFYKDFLSILFFETLNTKRKEDIFNFDNAQFILKNTSLVKIPFLSGGLFDEDDKKQRGIIFPANHIKSLFDFFNQYNFTIYEDSPNDHTVAVDPEMLGHIFENLLEDNKDKGAFYTPKEIVHYMCQESLIEYLTTWFENKGYEVVGYIGFDKPDQPKLFSVNEGRKGQLIMEADTKGIGKQIDRLLIEKLLKKKLDDDDKKLIKKHSSEFHIALDTVKICDPAIGSGAFPMGLLHEIFTTKQTLHAFEHGNTKTFNASAVKLNIIQNSIYGVDIEKGAVDIARLRFWLSLIVDENKPQALPNLDYKIVVGNSLVSKFDDNNIDIDWTLKEGEGFQSNIFGSGDLQAIKSKILKKISQEQKEFFNPESDKKKLSADIRKLKIDLLINQFALMIATKGLETKPTGTAKQLSQRTELYLQTLGWNETVKQLKKLKDKSEAVLNFFDWKLDFPEVLNEQLNSNAGFDIVIGNPPYVDYRSIDSNTKNAIMNFKVAQYSKMINLYNYFIETGFNLLKSKGCLSLITPQQFLVLENCKGVRDFIRNYNVISLSDFARVKVFNASTYTFVSIFKKEMNNIKKGIYFEFENLQKLDTPLRFIEFENPLCEPFSSSCHIDLLSKIEKININTLGYYINVFCASSSSHTILHNDAPKLYRFIQASDIFEYKLKLKENYISIKGYSENSLIKQKGEIIYTSRMTNKIRATLNNDNNIIGGKVNVLFSINKSITNRFILMLINSRLINFWYREKYNIQHMQGGALPINTTELTLIPMPNIPENQKSYDNIVNKILNYKYEDKDTYTLEQEIDNLVYRLYELTYIEVKVIDPEFTLTKKEYEAIKFD